MQLGFVIDHSRCIGCHACTVACKSENDVPLGDFRTWVKYTEVGVFPQVKRSFAVLRCNQCTAAPCVTICPTTALDKRSDGIVDINPDRCIGCKSCMQACPYDALYINDEHGTAEKCHFCAHRTEQGLAPACAVVCPTEAIIPGDFHDPESRVSQMREAGELTVRKAEAGTGPNVYYRDAAPAGLDPNQTTGAGGWLWANQLQTPQVAAEQWEAMEARARQQAAAETAAAEDAKDALARTVYDVQNPPLWGWKVSAYLFTKSAAAGAMLALLAFMRPWDDGVSTGVMLWGLGGALFWLTITTVLLIMDLKRPERFLFILMKGNRSSWLTRGAWLLVGYGGLLAIWFALWLFNLDIGEGALTALKLVTAPFALLSAIYTAWLFGQAKGRVLWMRRGLTLHLAAQAWVAGCAWLILSGPFLDWDPVMLGRLRWALIAGLVVHGLMTMLEGYAAPAGREREYARVHRLIHEGPFAKRHWTIGVALGIAVPLLVLPITAEPITWAIIGVLVLVGLASEEDTLVRAGQALPIH